MHNVKERPVVVTGAAGLIGSALIWALNRRGIDDIIVVDRLDESRSGGTSCRCASPIMSTPTTSRDGRERPGAFGSVGTVFHLGACSSTTERDADYLMRNNYEYTKVLAQWAVERDVRFVYASSAATYGGLEDLLSDDIDLRELRPLNMYAYSKQLFDLYAQRSGISDRIVGLKYFNIFGPNEDHKGDMRSIVCKAYEQIRSDGRVKLFKSYRPEFRDGEQRRDFLYVKDAVEMTVAVAQSDATGLVNVGSGRAQTWLDLVRPIFTALEIPERIEFIEMPELLRPKYQYSTQARIERLRGCGFVAPITTLDDAVRDYVTNYLKPGRVLDPAQQEALSVR